MKASTHAEAVLQTTTVCYIYHVIALKTSVVWFHSALTGSTEVSQ